MAFTNSLALVILLLLVALANFLWFFLLPAQGENHPLVKILNNIKRLIRRLEDSGEWLVLKKQVKQQQLNLSFLPAEETYSCKNIGCIRQILEAISLFAEANWQLYEIEDGEISRIQNLYQESLLILGQLQDDDLVFNIVIQKNTKLICQVDLKDAIECFRDILSKQLNSFEAACLKVTTNHLQLV